MLKATEAPIYITGFGYMGKKLLQALLQRHLVSSGQVTTIARRVPEPADTPYLIWDLDNPKACTESFSPTFPLDNAIIYYFVPPTPKGQYDLRARAFVQQLEQNPQAAVKKIVLISTTGVYGHCQGQWVDENTPVKPSVDRARRRADAEQQFQHYAQQHQVPLVILRVSGIYGPGKLPIKRLKAQTPIVREQDSPYSNRIHADDLLEICLRAGLEPAISGIYNCADGHPTTMYDYFTRVAQACQLPEPPAISLAQARLELYSGMLSYMDESRRIDNRKLLRDFRLQLKYPDLQKGLKSLA